MKRLLFAVLLSVFLFGVLAITADEVVHTPTAPAYPVPDDATAIRQVARNELCYTEQRDGTTKYDQ